MHADIPQRTGRERGVTTLLAVAFMGVLTLIMTALTGYVFQQAKYGRALHAREEALSIAESGLEYFKWHVAHNESIREDGTGLQSSYSYTVNDPEGGELGTAALSTSAHMQCGRVQWIDVESEGTSNADVRFKRTLSARYLRPSVAEYAFVTESPVFYTSDVTGPVHGNSGIRMDGTNNSTVSSKLGENAYYCDGSSTSLGCTGVDGNPSPGYKNGVFGSGSNDELWQYPVVELNFATMFAGTDDLRSYAVADGIMLYPTYVARDGSQIGSSFSSVGASEQKGFHVVFKTGGLVDIYRVTSVQQIASYNTDRGYLYGSNYCWFLETYYPGQYPCEYTYDYPDIASETLVASNVSIPSDCSLIYSDTKTWISGTVGGKVTVVANDTGSFEADILIGGTTNINDGYIAYETTDGTTGLTAIAERSVRVAHYVPDNMSIRGTFVAQSGYYGRDHYYYTYNVNPYYGGSLSPYRYRSSLTLNGTIVTSGRAATYYGSSGFQTRNTTYDRLQAFDFAPFTPSARADYGYSLWNEE